MLRLDDPGSIWIVETGSVALFSVPLNRDDRDALGGPRRYLFSVGPGEAMFGLPPADGDACEIVIAVALEDSVLRHLGALEPGQTPPGSRLTGAELADRWVANWNRSALGLDLPEPGDPGTLPGALREFHAGLMRRLEEAARKERTAERARIEDRERRSGEVVSRALSELTSVLEPRCDAPPQGSDLFVAACLVGQFLGIRMRRPSPWQQASGGGEQVEAIAQASHVRVRKVVLHDGWWRSDCGPLLAFRGARPLTGGPASLATGLPVRRPGEPRRGRASTAELAAELRARGMGLLPAPS